MNHKILNYNDKEIWVGMRRYYYPKSDEELREILDFVNEKYQRIDALVNGDISAVKTFIHELVHTFTKEKDNCGSLSTSRCLSAARVDRAFASDVIIFNLLL